LVVDHITIARALPLFCAFGIGASAEFGNCHGLQTRVTQSYFRQVLPFLPIRALAQ
jgi:hypothetical protein